MPSIIAEASLVLHVVLHSAASTSFCKTASRGQQTLGLGLNKGLHIATEGTSSHCLWQALQEQHPASIAMPQEKHGYNELAVLRTSYINPIGQMRKLTRFDFSKGTVEGCKGPQTISNAASLLYFVANDSLVMLFLHCLHIQRPGISMAYKGLNTLH